MSLYYKLKRADLDKLVELGKLTPGQAEKLRTASLKRKPGKFANDHEVVRYWLNKAETIRVQSIHFYGGENFGEPYCWMAEVVNCTTNSAFSRWINALKVRRWPAMTY